MSLDAEKEFGVTAIGSKRPENEAVFRAANENVKGKLGRLTERGLVPFICECSDADCMDVVEVSISTFEDIHLSRTRFLLRAGHETSGHEDVVGQHDGYVIVEKRNGDLAGSPETNGLA